MGRGLGDYLVGGRMYCWWIGCGDVIGGVLEGNRDGRVVVLLFDFH